MKIQHRFALNLILDSQDRLLLLLRNDQTSLEPNKWGLPAGKIETTETLDKHAQKKYKYGFVTDIDSDRPKKGLSEETIKFISNKKNEPDLSILLSATRSIGSIIKKKDIVIYESTVYPGCTEEDCVPLLEKESGLKYNKDFFCGYSPERINPGDKKHNVTNIKKITSGSTPKIANLIDELYNEIVKVGTHKAPSIKVAEAAKVIENTQRDLNIALINELSIFFNKLK